MMGRETALLNWGVVLLSEDILNAAVQITVIGGAIWSIISYAILRPLNQNIMRLEKSLDIMTVKIEEGNTRSRETEIKLAAVDASCRSAHRRLDVLLTFCRKTHENFPAKDR